MALVHELVDTPSYISSGTRSDRNRAVWPQKTDPDSSSGRASTSVAVGRGFESRPRHTKGIRNGTSSSLAGARIKKGEC